MKAIQAKKILSLFARAVIALFFFLPIFAQDTDDIIRVETQLVPFEVTVTDKDGKPVRGLEAKDFKVFEDGVERPVDFFETVKKNDESRPLAIVFALDVSGSMTPAELSRLRDALRNFIKRLADYNSYFAVMTFGMEVKTLQSFTNRPERLEKTFEKLFRDTEGLSTHAYDAADEAVRLIQKKSPAGTKNKPPKRAVVLITDGFPVGDTIAPQTVIERANDAQTTIYSIILPSYSRLQADKKPLPTPLDASGLIEKTGGYTFYTDEKSFELLFKSLAEEITASYVLAFYPKAENKRAGKFRRIYIEAPKGLQIKQNRSGYKPKA